MFAVDSLPVESLNVIRASRKPAEPQRENPAAKTNGATGALPLDCASSNAYREYATNKCVTICRNEWAFDYSAPGLSSAHMHAPGITHVCRQQLRVLALRIAERADRRRSRRQMSERMNESEGSKLLICCHEHSLGPIRTHVDIYFCAGKWAADESLWRFFLFRIISINLIKV